MTVMSSRGASVPEGTVTFLFTDIEGSTRGWAEHGDRFGAALERHDRIVRGALDARGGYVFATAGDSFAAAFADAGGAVEAASGIQRGLDADSFDEVGGLRVRIGLHTGSAMERDGDFFGPHVNLAARVMGAAHGGQVVVSAATAALVSAPLLDLGVHRLRDVAEPIELHQLLGEGLVAEFPGLRTLDAGRSLLPVQHTSFVGREAEIGTVRRLLDQARLVTLTGTGGTGKTRLAVEVAAQVAVGLDGRAVFVDLSTASDVPAIADALSAALGVALPGSGDAGVLGAAVADRAALFVIDNCEQVIDDAADLVAGMLDASPRVRVVATSREQFDVDGERTFRVPPLANDDAASDDAASDAAVRLFIDRALAVDQSLVVDAGGRETIREICGRLDGLPLAIELAAARTRTLSVREIAGRLDERFTLLTGGRRRSRQRQQTLDAMVAWSYDLLDAAEQRAFRRLGVFAGGFDLAGAAAVLGVDDAIAVEVVDSLVVKSLVVRTRTVPTSRYRLYETLRAFAEAKLTEHGETEAARDAHLAHYAALDGHLAIWGSAAYHEAVFQDFDNLLVAADWATARGADDAFTVLALCACTGMQHGLVTQPAKLLDQALQLAVDPLRRAELIQARIHTGIQSGPADWPDFAALVDEGFALLEPLSGPERDARLALHTAWAAWLLLFSAGSQAGLGYKDPAILDQVAALERSAVELAATCEPGIRQHVAYCRVLLAARRGDARAMLDSVRDFRADHDPARASIVVEPAVRGYEIAGTWIVGDHDTAVDLAMRAPTDLLGWFGVELAAASIVVLALSGQLPEARRRFLEVVAAHPDPSPRIEAPLICLATACIRVGEGDLDVATELMSAATGVDLGLPAPFRLVHAELRRRGLVNQVHRTDRLDRDQIPELIAREVVRARAEP